MPGNLRFLLTLDASHTYHTFALFNTWLQDAFNDVGRKERRMSNWT
jgi:hypothetical protein